MGVVAECIETAEYAVDRKMLVSLSLRRVARRWWWIAVLPLLGALVMLVIRGDIVWLLVALMISMLLWPWMVMTAYFSEALRPEVVGSMTIMRARITPDRVTFIKGEDSSERVVRWDEADSVSVRASFVALWHHGAPMIIPRSAMSDDAWDRVTVWALMTHGVG